MNWRKRNRKIAQAQDEAEQALAMTRIGYADMLNMQQLARRISEGHLRLQQENHFGLKVFGVEK